MKQYNRIILALCLLWLILTVISAYGISRLESKKENKEHLVEINRIMDWLSRQDEYSVPDLNHFSYIQGMDYLPVNQEESVTYAFFEGKELPSLGIEPVIKGHSFHISPYYTDTSLQGYIRFKYNLAVTGAVPALIYTELSLAVIFLAVLSILLYVRRSIIKPFHEILDLPYELSKGHLSKEIKESKSRYFGKFLWGLQLLREQLEKHNAKELQLKKDRKLMILSISHDIKTPLSSIKLYAKALYDNLYTSEEKKEDTARKIEEKADQIENYVSELMKTSSTEIFEFDIVMKEFYLRELIEAIRRSYEDKLALHKTEFIIDKYRDKLILGDKDKLIDVFDNLLQNAIKYGDGKRISISFDEEDYCQLIKISNTGEPLPSTHLHHIFESFWRGDNASGKPGNGLGLYICKQLLHKMEGEIFAGIEENGMSFTIVLRKE